MHWKRIVQASAIAAALTLALAMSATAAPQAADRGASTATITVPAPGTSVRLSGPAGAVSGTLHTMSANEIAAKGLTRYTAKLTTSSARVPGSVPTPAKVSSLQKALKPASTSGCWTWTFKQPGWLGMDGYGSEDWCGSGGWITYAAAGCWGTDGWYPTYNYLGCSTNKYYGKGWNVADTQYNWDMCIAWWGGGCAKHRHLWDRYRYGATGGVWLISHGG